MALFIPKKLIGVGKAIPYKGKPDPKEATVKALNEAQIRKEKSLKEAAKQLQKSNKKGDVVVVDVSEEIEE